MEGLKLKRLSICNKSLQSKWKEWEKDTSTSPFMYFEYTRFIYIFYKYFYHKYTPIIYCVLDKTDNILMILPLKKRLFGGYFLLNDIQGSGAAGCICDPNLDNKTREECLNKIFHEVNDITLQRLRPENYLYNYITKLNKFEVLPITTCVSIPIPHIFEDWFLTLSSSSRQNVRTAYNRLKRDGLTFKTITCSKSYTLSDEKRKQIMSLYTKRLFTKYNKTGNIKTIIKKMLYKYIKHDTLSLFKLDNTFHNILYINGKPAAFLSGFIDHGNSTIVVPRLAVDIEYKFYSPGYVLLYETIKQLAEEGAIKQLDLSRGDEKYKLDLGGQKYSTYAFRL